ncbi:MAG TPA: flagellar motor protein MotB [Kofleriaceae bacterium]|nr:flagellar motor protein MotB [Kofleriaceae bacterium]
MARKIKKVDGGHGHHGGAWKVAYADFVTAMMALFMVLWLLASTDQQSRKEISNYFRTGLLPQVDTETKGSPNTSSVFQSSLMPPTPSPGIRGSGEAGGTSANPDNLGVGSGSGNGDLGSDDRVRAASELMKRLNRYAELDGELAQVMRNVHVQVTADGIVIDAVDEGKGLLFDMASSRLNEPLERFLHALAPAIAALDHPIEINGHTDARPFVAGAGISNWDLSYQRAAAAREILEASGVPSPQVLGVFARGASQLYVPDDPYAPQNRRLSILVKIAKNGGGKLAATDPVMAN